MFLKRSAVLVSAHSPPLVFLRIANVFCPNIRKFAIFSLLFADARTHVPQHICDDISLAVCQNVDMGGPSQGGATESGECRHPCPRTPQPVADVVGRHVAASCTTQQKIQEKVPAVRAYSGDFAEILWEHGHMLVHSISGNPPRHIVTTTSASMAQSKFLKLIKSAGLLMDSGL
jgi:hypothetical protein